LAVLEHLDRSRYEVVSIGITRDGRWLLIEDPGSLMENGGEIRDGIPIEESWDSVFTRLFPPRPPAAPSAESPSDGERTGSPPTVFFPMLPGAFGEDGSIQGLFEMAGVPYVGAGVLASAVGMDKAVAKALFLQAGLPVVPHRMVLRSAWEAHPDSVVESIEREFRYPTFIKPANSGSSLGVNKVWDRDGLVAGLDEAAEWDRRLVVEAAIDAREIELAVLGNDDPVVSIPAEVVPGAEFYSFRDKHIDEKAEEIIPAPLTPEQTQGAQELALAAFRALDCCGMARVDLLLDRRRDRFWVSELNTMPGLRKRSTYPRTLEAMGYTYPQILDRLVELALERWRDRRRNRVRVPDSV
jgi:D-alanine-D-alanine ligase